MRNWSLRILTTLTLLLSVTSYAQLPELKFGSCPGEGAPSGRDDMAVALEELKKGNFELASQIMNSMNQRDLESPHFKYLLGELYFRRTPRSQQERDNNLSVAERSWEECLRDCPNYKPELNYLLGRIKIINNKLDEGVALLDEFIDHPDSDAELMDLALNAYEQALFMQELMANPVEYNVNVVRGVSTPNADEYLTAISPDGQLAFFTRRMGGGETFTRSEMTGRGFNFGTPMPRPFNANFNEGSPTITADNRLLIFTSCEPTDDGLQNCDLYYSVRNGDSWSQIQPIGDAINSPDSWESQPSVSPNGDKLYFASNREGGLGGIDIYVSHRQPDGSWGEAQNLGAPINTPGNEKSPFLHTDSRTLYFASRGGHLGMGGYDLFYARLTEDGTYDEPKNVGYPINTQADEVGLIVNLPGTKAYFNSNDPETGGLGGWDLFEFTMPEEARPEEVAIVRGVLRDENGRPMTTAEVTMKNTVTNEETRLDVDRSNGEYTAVVSVARNEDVIIKVEGAEASFSTRYIDVDEVSTTEVVEADMDVAKLEVGKEYRLNDVHFETDSYELDQQDKFIIDEFAIFLQEHPTVTVDIQGHTDNVGGIDANLVLSRNRARVVYERLIAKGISSSRMTHNGFGESRPVAPNRNDRGRAMNRRTVFVITSL